MVNSNMAILRCCKLIPNVMLADAVDGLSFDTVYVYVPETITVRVCVYCAVKIIQ